MKSLAVIVIISLTIMGCSSFNPNNKYVVFSGNNYYKVPHHSQYSSLRIEEVKYLNSLGISNCFINDIFWKEDNIFSALASKKIDSKELSLLYKSGFNRKTLGCSSEMSREDILVYNQKLRDENLMKRDRMFDNNGSKITKF